jgi:hypothetical protein
MADRGGDPWINEDVATLKRMYLAGGNNLSMARALGRTQTSIVAKISLLRKRRVLGTPPGKKGINTRNYGA